MVHTHFNTLAREANVVQAQPERVLFATLSLQPCSALVSRPVTPTLPRNSGVIFFGLPLADLEKRSSAGLLTRKNSDYLEEG